MSRDNCNPSYERGIIAAILGGSALGACIGILLGAFLGKRAAEGSLPDIDIRELPDRIKQLSDEVSARFGA